MNHLELFSGTHSFGKVSSKMGYNVISLDRDLGAECPFGGEYISKHHIKEDIFTWDYKKYPKGHFQLITASPVCMWWSVLRLCNIGRKLKAYDKPLTREMIEKDIETCGMPMVDKVFEIMEYFNPQYFIIENPSTGRMKEYIPESVPFYDVDYCKYSDWGYKKGTRFWTNIEGFKPKTCKKDCDNMVGNAHLKGVEGTPSKKRLAHKKQIGHNEKCNWDGSQKLERYRIPENLIYELLIKLNKSK